MSSSIIILIAIVALIGLLVGAAVWIRSKGVAAGKQEIQTDLATQQNARLQQGAEIDAKPLSTDNASDIARKLARRNSPRS